MKIDWLPSRSWGPPAVITRTAWAGVSVLASLLLLSFYSHPLGAYAGFALAGLAVLAAVRPYEALLLLAAFSPIASMLFVVSGIEAGGLRVIEAMTVAYLAGWAARRVVRLEPLAVSRALRWSAAALILAALASGVISGAVILTEHGGDTTWRLLDDLFRWYAVHTDAVAFAMIFAEGVLLLLAVANTCAASPVRREGVVRMMVIGAAAAASFNLLRIVVDGAMPREHPWRELLSLFLHLRVNVHHTDLNAAGSYFAMLWFLSLGFAARAPRAGGACLLLISAGLWMAGSRVAMAATLVIAAIVVAVRLARYRNKWAVVIVPLLLATAVAAVLAQSPLQRHGSDPALALRIRLGLATGAIAMAADHPVFGVGLGRFSDLSDRYVHVPNYSRENAHNNFLQILAELGVPGLVLFLAVLGTALAAAWHQVDQSTWPVVAGIGAYLLTCIGGHPLLVPHAAFPFWMALGVAASSSARPAGARGITMVALALAGVFVVTLPSRTLAAVRGANVEHTSIGFSLWQREANGARYRWAGGRATFYVPSSAQAVRIPLRHGTEGPGTLELRIFLEGREADRVLLRAGDEWKTVRLVLGSRVEAPFSRIDLEAWIPGAPVPLDAKPTGAGGVLMVGRPEFERPSMLAVAHARTNDFDGDGTADIGVFRPGSGAWHVIGSATGTATGTWWGSPGDTPVPGDYDGDGKTDYAVYRASSSAWHVLQSTTGSAVALIYGIAGDVPVPADYDGDGQTDLAVFRPSTSAWYIVPSTTGTAYGVSWGVSGDLPIPADFDGDGKADPTVFRPSTSTWHQLRSTTGAAFAVVWGMTGDIPLAGDYDGDGKADPTAYRSSTGTWYQLRSRHGAWFGGHWGVIGDVPIVGDYDGDGKADLTVFRPSTSTWYQLRSATGTGSTIVWGLPGDLPM